MKDILTQPPEHLGKWRLHMTQVRLYHLGICPISKFQTSKLKPVTKRPYKFGVSACYSPTPKNYYSHDQDWVYDLMVRNRTPYQMIRYKGLQWLLYALFAGAVIYFSNGIAQWAVRHG
jgi:hypothetical protein